MKKKFKTIMALTAALAISMSGMCIAVPENLNDDDGDGVIETGGTFSVTTLDRLSATIDMGDLDLVFDLNTNKWTAGSFDGQNNLIAVTNRSTCDLNLTYGIQFEIDTSIRDEAEALQKLSVSGFRLTESNVNGGEAGVLYCTASVDGKLSESDPITLEADGYSTVFLTLEKPDYSGAYQTADFKNENIGRVTVKLEKADTGE